ncbi:hypothetical protein [Spiroplasma endosymbiont of Phycita roborella]|uniref:hypothetical protein n=1 Tax=Spiroplasma endosymbiont of Phycita roborella TaxID=3066311 RepID=UPI00313F375C
MKEVFKMSPLFTGKQNPNIRRMSDDSAISLLGSSGDFSSISNSSTISIFEVDGLHGWVTLYWTLIT